MDYNITNSRINNTHGVNKMNDDKELSFQDRVDEMIAKVFDRTEREVPEYGAFSDVAEYMPNLDPETKTLAGKYGLRIYKMPKSVVEDPKQRYIEAAAYRPAGDYKADVIVGSGHKDEILKILNSDEFPEKLNRTYGELLETLEDV